MQPSFNMGEEVTYTAKRVCGRRRGGLGDIQINESFFTLSFIKLISLALIIIRLSLVLVYYTEEAGIELNDVQSGNHYVKMLNFPKRIHYIFFLHCVGEIFLEPGLFNDRASDAKPHVSTNLIKTHSSHCGARQLPDVEGQKTNSWRHFPHSYSLQKKST